MVRKGFRQRFSSQSGMSMIEMLVAVVILAVGLLGLAELQVTAIRANSQSNVTVAAAAIAQRVIETVAAMSPDDIIFDNGTINATWAGSPLPVPGSGSFNITYTVRRSVDPADVDPSGPGYLGVQDLCRVDVKVETVDRVAWGYGLKKKHSVTMTTIKRAS